MNDKLNNFYLNHEEPYKSCLLALRDIILAFDLNLIATIKYGMPCFTFKGKHICYLWTDKKSNEPYLLMVDGNNIEHPKLETGDRKRMKIFRVNPNEDIPIEDIHSLLDQAINSKPDRSA